MQLGSHAFRLAPIVAQLALATMALVTMAVAPPARGTYLLVPIGAAASARLAAIAIDNGAAIVARGKLPASLVVAGDRDRLFAPLLAAGIVTIAGSAASCGPGGVLSA